MSEQNIEWTKLAEEKSFENNSEQLHKVKRDDILIIKDDDGFHAINNRCPHPVSYTHLTLPTIRSV